MAEIDFTKYQQNVCEDPPEAPPIKEVCSPCEPNPNFIEPDWTKLVGEPYLNQKTCEYMICVTLNKKGDSAKLGGISGNSSVLNFRDYPPGPKRSRLLRSYVQPALVLMLQRYGKLVADQILCAHFNGPTLQGLSPNELLESYDGYSDVYELLKDDPVENIKDAVENYISGPKNPAVKPCKTYDPPVFDNVIPTPGEPFSITEAIIEIMSTAPQVTNPYALEIYGYPKDFYIESGGPLKVLVAIPAFIFEAVPDTPSKKDLEEQAIKIKDEVEIDISSFFGQVTRLSTTLLVYGKYQSHFYQSQDGFIVFKTPGVCSIEGSTNQEDCEAAGGQWTKEKSRDFYASQYSKKVLEFYNKLKEVGKDNKYNLRSQTPSVIRANAEKLKIKFDTSDPANPYKIMEIRAKAHGCPYTTFTKSLDKLEIYNKDPTLLNYFAKIIEIDTALNAKKSYPWMDFLIKFTFPLLSVSYGNLNIDAIEETAGSCVAENALSFGVDLKDYILDEVLSLMEVFQFTYSSHGCTDLEDKTHEPEEAEWQKKKSPTGRQAKKEVKSNQEAEIQQQLESYTNSILQYEQQKSIYEKELKDLKSGNMENVEQSRYISLEQSAELKEQDYNRKIDSMKSMIKKLEKKKKEEYKKINKLSRKDNRKEALAARKSATAARMEEDHPYVLKARELAMEKIATQDNLLTTLYNFDDYQEQGLAGIKGKDLSSDDTFKKLFKRMSLCNTRSLTIQGMRCLFSGVTEENALTKIIKVTLSAMDVDVFGIFVKNLPPEIQVELKQKLEKEFANLPLPWEEGYDPGALGRQNPYTLALKTPSERLEDKADRTERRAQRASDKLKKHRNDPKSPHHRLAVEYEWIMDTDLPPVEQKIEQFEAAIQENKEQQEFLLDMFGEAEEVLPGTQGLAPIPLDPQAEILYKNLQKDINVGVEELEILQEEKDKLDKRLKRIEDQFQKDVDKEADLLGKEFDLLEELSSLTDEEKVQAAESLTKQSRIEMDGDPDNLGSPGTYGTALGNAQELIMEAYIDMLMDAMEIDKIYAILDRFPGSEVVGAVLRDLGCSTQGMFNPPIKSFLSTMALDTCGGPSGGFTLPSIDKIPNFSVGGLLLPRLKKLFIDKLEAVIIEVMKRLILKVLETIDISLCQAINAAGNSVANIFSPDGLDDAMKEAFCPDGDEDDLKNTKDNLFNASGLADNMDDSSFDCLYKVLNSILSKNDYINLFTNTPSNMDPETLRKIAEAVKAFCPEFADVFGTPDQIADIFGKMNKYIPPDLRDFLNNEANTTPDGPLYDAICLTQEQFDQWNEDRKNLLTAEGLDRPTAQDMIDKANKRVLDDLGTLADILAKGPDGMVKDAVGALMNPTDPTCAADKGLMVFEDQAEADDKSEMLKGFFEMLEKLFYRDLIGRPRSLLNNILRDSNNVRLGSHELYVNYPYLFPNYVNSDADWDFRKENGSKLYTWAMEKKRMKGMFPETVGLWLKKELDKQTFTYKSSAGPDEPVIVMEYADNGGGEGDPEYKFELNYYVEREPKSLIEVAVDETFLSTLTRRQKKKLGLEDLSLDEVVIEGEEIQAENFVNIEDYETFNYNNYKQNFSYQSRIFKSFLENKVSGPINDNNTLKTKYGEINSIILNFARDAVTRTPDNQIPTGFKFGYDIQSAITFPDLLYVDPDANPDDPSTWKYTYDNEDAVLGKSATENPRVHFLDPAIHGGSYKFPFKFIEPATYNGWLGMIRTFIPEVKECDDKDTGFLEVSSISKRAKDVENNLPFDERLSYALTCRLEAPYDKIAAPATHGIMEGVVISTTKVYATEFILRTMPVFSSVEFSELNIDNTLLAVLMKEIQKGLMNETTRWNIVQGYTYYLLFLEQAVQTVQRQIKDGLMEKTPEIKKAMQRIDKAQKAYDPFNPQNFLEGAAIIAFGTEAFDESGKISMDKIKKGSVKLAWKMKSLSEFKLLLATKIKTINDTKKEAEIIYSALVEKEMSALVDKINFNLRPKPHVKDIRKYLLSRNGIMFGSSLRSGEMKVEQPIFEGQTGMDYGNIPNVVRDVNTENPLSSVEIMIGAGNFSVPGGGSLGDFFLDGATSMAVEAGARFIRDGAEGAIGVVSEFMEQKFSQSLDVGRSGIFYLEKYLRVTSKGGTTQVYNISEFQDMLRNGMVPNMGSKISDNFGNAEIVNEELVGTTGIKFGVRLVYSPPAEFDYEIPAARQRERTYKFPSTPVKIKFKPSFYEILESLPDKVKEYLEPALEKMEIDIPGLSRAIPLVIFEQDIKDKKISDIDLDDPDFGEDLKCYIDNLVLEDDFDVLFDFCFPIRSYISLFGIYSYYGFFASIGEDTDEIDEDARGLANDRWRNSVFRRSKNALRELFNSTYRTDDDVKEERKGKSKDKNAKFLKNLLPDLYLNIDSSVRWWQQFRMMDINPFDADGNACKNDFQSLFD